jgi:DNA polymerase III epsilon subunit-like protein
VSFTKSSGGLHELDIALTQAEYIVFDIETTGGNPERNGITEICAIKYRDGVELGRFYSLVNPMIPIPPIVRKMTGISNKTVQDAPLIDAVMPDFLKFAQRGILVSHNTIGDLKFIRHFAKETANHEFDNYFLCTHLLVDKLFPEAPDKSLNGLGKFFGVQSAANLHRADADAELTLQVFDQLVQRLKKNGVKTVAEAVRFQGDYESAVRLGWGIDNAKVEALPDEPGVLRLKDRHGRDTFVSSATSLRREARRLSQLNQVPRGLLRSVVQSHDLEGHATTTHFESLLLESDLLERAKLKFDPASWHQKNLLTLNFVVDSKNKQTRVVISPVPEGCIGIFGPIRDRKAAQNFLDELAAKLGFEITRKGMQIPGYAVAPLMAFFANRLDQWKGSDAKNLLKLMKNLFRRTDVRSVEVVEKLRAIAPPKKLSSLHDMKGVIILYDDAGDHAYPYSSGDIMGRGKKLKHRWREPHPMDELSDLFRALNKVRPSPQGVAPLKASNAVRFNSILWWIYSGSNRREGAFIHPTVGDSR